MMSLLLLGAALVVGLLLVPLGLPGLWVMLAAAVLHWWLVPAGPIGLGTVAVSAALIVAAEILEFTIAGRYARTYGGSRRASIGAMVGGVAGAILGVPVPIVGSMIGALVGAFAGAFAAEWTVAAERRGQPLQVAKGALIGRAVAAAVKTGIALAVMAWIGTAVFVQRITGG